MRISTKPLISAVTLMMLAAPAMAQQAKVYTYESQANYCPAGLQPVTISGVICCGQPNQAQSYQQALRHPVSKLRHQGRSARADMSCPENAKGCY